MRNVAQDDDEEEDPEAGLVMLKKRPRPSDHALTAVRVNKDEAHDVLLSSSALQRLRHIPATPAQFEEGGDIVEYMRHGRCAKVATMQTLLTLLLITGTVNTTMLPFCSRIPIIRALVLL